MGKKTLYVSGEDEAIWIDAQKLGAVTDESLSKVATAALRELVEAERGAQIENRPVTVSLTRRENKTVTGKLRSLIRQFGQDRVAIAFARACSIEGAAHSRAGRKAAETKGPAGRSAAAIAAADTRKQSNNP